MPICLHSFSFVLIWWCWFIFCVLKSLILFPICCQEDIAIIFSKADNNKSGTLTLKDFQEVVDDILERYPQVKLHLKRKKMRNFAALLIDSQENAHNQTIEIENFKSALSEVDSQMKNLPATAQVPVNFFGITHLNSNKYDLPFLSTWYILGGCSTGRLSCWLFQPHGGVWKVPRRSSQV